MVNRPIFFRVESRQNTFLNRDSCSLLKFWKSFLYLVPKRHNQKIESRGKRAKSSESRKNECFSPLLQNTWKNEVFWKIKIEYSAKFGKIMFSARHWFGLVVLNLTSCAKEWKIQEPFPRNQSTNTHFVIFRRIWNIQEKLFIQYSVHWGQISFFFNAKLPTLFIQK